MPVIKAADAPQHGVVRFSLRDIEAEANETLERARAEADAILADARARAAQIESDARAAGFAQGRVEGIVQGEELGKKQAIEQQAEELHRVIELLSDATEQVQALRNDARSDLVREAVDLAIAIAHRVTKRQSGIDPHVLTANLLDALSLVGRGSQLRLAVNPVQREVLAETLPVLRIEWPALGQAEIVDDPTLLPGGCRVFTSHGRIDADLAAQLERIVKDLMPPENFTSATGVGGNGANGSNGFGTGGMH